MKIGMISKFPEQEDGIAIYSESLCSELEIIGIKIVRIGDLQSNKADYKIDFNSIRIKAKLREIIEKEHIDLLHIQYIADYFGNFQKFGVLNIFTKFFYSMLLINALKQDVPAIVTFHEVHTEFDSLRGNALNFLQNALAKKAEAVIAHTRQHKEFIQVKYGKKRAYHILHGLVLKQMHRLKAKNVLFFGMLNYGKGVEYLIRAMEFLNGYQLTIAGKAINPDYEKIIKNTASQNRLGNVKLDIRWVPENEKNSIMTEADVMVFPYIWAPYQSGTMHNAFGYGIPVVVTNAGALSEVVKEYVCGRIVEQRSPKALAEGIRAVLGNYGTYQRGVENYRKQANWPKVAEKHAEAYYETLQEHYEAHGLIEKERKEKEKIAKQFEREDS